MTRRATAPSQSSAASGVVRPAMPHDELDRWLRERTAVLLQTQLESRAWACGGVWSGGAL